MGARTVRYGRMALGVHRDHTARTADNETPRSGCNGSGRGREGTPVLKTPPVSQDTTPRPLLMTPREAARELSLSRSTVYELLAKGRRGSPDGIRGIKVGAATRIPLVEVEAWLSRQLGDEVQR